MSSAKSVYSSFDQFTDVVAHNNQNIQLQHLLAPLSISAMLRCL